MGATHHLVIIHGHKQIYYPISTRISSFPGSVLPCFQYPPTWFNQYPFPGFPSRFPGLFCFPIPGFPPSHFPSNFPITGFSRFPCLLQASRLPFPLPRSWLPFYFPVCLVFRLPLTSFEFPFPVPGSPIPDTPFQVTPPSDLLPIQPGITPICLFVFVCWHRLVPALCTASRRFASSRSYSRFSLVLSLLQ